MAAVPVHSDFEAQEKKLCHCFHFFPFYLPWSGGNRCVILSFWMLFYDSFFHSPLSPSSRSSLVPLQFLPLEWYHLNIWGCWYFACQSWFQLVFHPVPVYMMYSTYKLNKQGDNTQLCWTHFPILSHSIVPCPVQTVASWPHISFSGNRKGSLILPSFWEFFPVCCGSHRQRL